MSFSTKITRPLQLITRTLQWSSAVIVMGLTSYFIHHGPRGQHTIYQEVISTISVVFFLPAFISPFLPSSLSKVVLAIDVVFSYLWLTAFIFAAQDYSTSRCYYAIPAGLGCKRKRANEAFIFLAFIFTFFGMLLEVAALWAYRRENNSNHSATEPKYNSGTRPPMDAPAAPAGTV
ncbi:hypothetical protein N7491_005294 [Penicillium cf. griseofulvum]|uniref:MARVEL domain-containing protein n=1 Tax=Penicillium cf. griseofulvum TaxID=2972120 RepID=A0A9W9J363_9EURO|nr:hypothetical protein N7472_007986 [Penicillium cf. griseofulvum]KAJ5434699.1 hypothetical protein N7491_005294 [Penicillium cf. griseofulvum]KAJ5452529.1 hypothetical protein N7445_000712 [Penicillium cf. griseofulvum]